MAGRSKQLDQIFSRMQYYRKMEAAENNTAATIIEQLGGNKFLSMTGAKNLVKDQASLTFDLPRGTKNKANKCKVTYSGKGDDYIIHFYRYSPKSLELKEISADSATVENLRQIFTARTGLQTSLGTMGRK